VSLLCLVPSNPSLLEPWAVQGKTHRTLKRRGPDIKAHRLASRLPAPPRLTTHCPPWHVPVDVPVVQEAPFARGV
jgi:hypothetical protein